jgi:hypothetical protein
MTMRERSESAWNPEQSLQDEERNHMDDEDRDNLYQSNALFSFNLHRQSSTFL